MLTDDDLTRQLGAAFDAETDGMTYEGASPRVRTRPVWARPGLIALPAAGAVAAAVLVLGSTGGTTPPAAPSATADATTAAPSQSASADSTVTDQFTLAGMTFTYERGSEDFSMDMLAVFAVDEVPAWAQPVELESGASAKVWVGVDPESGRASMLVESPVRWGGKLTGLASPNLSVQEMTEVAKTGTLS